MNKRLVTIKEINQAARNVADEIFFNTMKKTKPSSIKLYGVPRGGIPAAFAVANQLREIYIYSTIVDDPNEADAIIDDLIDSGRTRERYQAKPFYALFDKRRMQDKPWLVMPWEATEEHDESATDIVTRLLQYIGEDPDREGLKETPKRVLKAWEEWATGYKTNVSEIFKTFEDGACDEMVIVHNIPVISKCEHHLADIVGHAHVGYIPNGRIVGLSKLARLVDAFSRRLQVQERLTTQIADALEKHLVPIGVGVLIRASHACMSTRGVKVHGSDTTTSAMRGALMQKGPARQEFLDLCRMAER